MLGVGIVDTFFHECFMLGGFQSPNISMVSSDAIDKQGAPVRYLLGREAVTDIEHVKSVTGAKVKRPYHKSVVKAEIEKEISEEEEHRFTLIDWYIHILASLNPAVYEI